MPAASSIFFSKGVVLVRSRASSARSTAVLAPLLLLLSLSRGRTVDVETLHLLQHSIDLLVDVFKICTGIISIRVPHIPALPLRHNQERDEDRKRYEYARGSEREEEHAAAGAT